MGTFALKAYLYGLCLLRALCCIDLACLSLVLYSFVYHALWVVGVVRCSVESTLWVVVRGEWRCGAAGGVGGCLGGRERLLRVPELAYPQLSCLASSLLEGPL